MTVHWDLFDMMYFGLSCVTIPVASQHPMTIHGKRQVALVAHTEANPGLDVLEELTHLPVFEPDSLVALRAAIVRKQRSCLPQHMCYSELHLPGRQGSRLSCPPACTQKGLQMAANTCVHLGR